MLLCLLFMIIQYFINFLQYFLLYKIYFIFAYYFKYQNIVKENKYNFYPYNSNMLMFPN